MQRVMLKRYPNTPHRLLSTSQLNHDFIFYFLLLLLLLSNSNLAGYQIRVYQSDNLLQFEFLKIFSGKCNTFVDLVRVCSVANSCRGFSTGLSTNSSRDGIRPFTWGETKIASGL